MKNFELRLAREQRRTARIQARSAENVAKWEYRKSVDDETRQIRAVAFAIAVFLISFVAFGMVCGAVKHHDEQNQVTNCERFVTQAHVEADCSSGKIKTGSAG